MAAERRRGAGADPAALVAGLLSGPEEARFRETGEGAGPARDL